MATRAWRILEPGQISRLVVVDIASGERTIVHESADAVFEAPNWTVSPYWGGGEWLVFNQDGLIYRIPAPTSYDRQAGDVEPVPTGVEPVPTGVEPVPTDVEPVPTGVEPVPTDVERVVTGAIDSSNNDHVVSPDGRYLYISAEDKHIHEVSLADGTTRQVTHKHDRPFNHYLHGISPDGRTLSYIGLEPLGPNPGPGTPARTNVFTIGIDGEDDTQLTHSDAPHDGAEFDPTGEWIYFNSERESQDAGHAQLFRCRPDGSAMEQLTFDERVNWFPHVAPGGRDLVYVSYPPGVVGHPANEPVRIRRIDPDGGAPTDVVELFGGQGTMNVASWSPDGRRFAYVEYPMAVAVG